MKVIDGNRPSSIRLDVDGIINNPGSRPRARARGRLLCTWREACEAVDEVLEHFGSPSRDRGIWVWYCQRIGRERFLDLAYDVVSSYEQHEIKYPVRAFQRHLMDTFPKGGAK